MNVLLKIGGSTGSQGKVTQAFSDHPDTQKRANHIKEMAEAAGYKMTTSGSANNITTTTTTTPKNNKGKTVIKKGGSN